MTDIRPLDIKFSSSRNIHVFTSGKHGEMILAPSPFGLKWGLICLAFLPFLLFLCHHFSAEQGLWLSAILFPCLAGGGFLLGHFGFASLGTRVCLNDQTETILISGARHSSTKQMGFSEVHAIQLVYAGVKSKDDGEWDNYQINFVFNSQERYNILSSGGIRQLDQIGEALAQYIQVPYERQYKKKAR